MRSLVVVMLLSLLPGAAAAQQPDLRIDAETRKTVVEAAARALEAQYVYPDVGAKMAAAVRERASRGEYDRITLGPVLADVLTLHLREVSRDKHVGLFYRADPIPEEGAGPPPAPADDEPYNASARRQNFGFERLERLPGNVGYLDLRGLYRAEVGAETAAHAMAFLAHTDALILDLRRNSGGNPSMIVFLASYLFDRQPVQLTGLYWREGGRTVEHWTLPYVPGARYVDKPVWVLTSEQTFSGGEALAYDLKNLKRAKVVGETTGGGANPGRGRRLHEHFEIFVPAGRAVSPVTGTSWEGAGVEPDVKVPAGYALEWAHLDALETLAASGADVSRKRALESAARDAAKALGEAKARTPAETPPSLAGNTELRLRGAP